MKKLSALIAALFASATLSVLAQPATAPAKPATDTAKTTTPAAPVKAEAAKEAQEAGSKEARAEDGQHGPGRRSRRWRNQERHEDEVTVVPRYRRRSPGS